MKKVLIFIGIIIWLVLPMSLKAEENGKNHAYRAFSSPGISPAMTNDILAHVNYALRNYYREFTRGETSISILRDEQEFIKFLVDAGLFNTNAQAKPKTWEEVDYAIFIEKRLKNDFCQISIISLDTGEIYRTPVYSNKSHHIAKSIAGLMSELAEDTNAKNMLKKNINSYFSAFRNYRTIDLYYNGIIFDAEEMRVLPINAGVGISIPVKGPLSFGLRFSGTYSNEQIDVSAGLGLLLQRNGRFSPEFGLFGGYLQHIQDEEFSGGPFIEPGIGLGFYISENLKISATGSFQASYFPSSEEIYARAYAGVKISLGF